MAANMDTVGLFSVAKEMSKNQLFTAIDKHITVDEWVQFLEKNPECADVIYLLIFTLLNILFNIL